MGEDAPHERLTPRDGRTLRLLVFVGTRPEAVKLLPIVVAASEYRDVAVRLVSSGQHPKAMLEVLDHFRIRVDGDIALFEAGQTLPDITVGAVRGFADELAAAEPDVVVVQGDTTTAFAGALVAFYAKVPVAHVEAGLRTHDPVEPFPEEMNRRLIDAVASHLFPPTAVAARNLAAEGIAGEEVFVTGNTIVDALRSILEGGPVEVPAAARSFLEDPGWDRHVLVTAHRRESWGPPLDEIAAALGDVATGFPRDLFLVPLHPNPIVRRSFARRELPPNLLLVEPLPYPQFIVALERSDLVLTDSGGVLEEATVLGKRTLIMRERTERPESVAAGVARVVGTGRAGIARAAVDALAELAAGELVAPQGVFGDGYAAERTVDWLRWRYGLAAARPTPFSAGVTPSEPRPRALSRR